VYRLFPLKQRNFSSSLCSSHHLYCIALKLTTFCSSLRSSPPLIPTPFAIRFAHRRSSAPPTIPPTMASSSQLLESVSTHRPIPPPPLTSECHTLRCTGSVGDPMASLAGPLRCTPPTVAPPPTPPVELPRRRRLPWTGTRLSRLVLLSSRRVAAWSS